MKFIGQTTGIDWDAVISKCKEGNTLQYKEGCFPDTEDFRNLNSMWQNAGYKLGDPVVEWTNYFPEQFGQEVVERFQQQVNAKPWMVWISKIQPGRMAPWHFDAHQNINEFLKLGNPVRFTCYIQEPQHGHISIVGDSAVYRPAKGSIYQWPSYDAWHCGMNGGLTDKYMFNYWGYQQD